MSYLHIENLYKARDILLFRECFALEKVHGTSAHVAWTSGSVRFSSGGASYKRFVELFDEAALRDRFTAVGHPAVGVYGEAYGGSEQGMSRVYGKELAFIAFDVKVGDVWLAVPDMVQVVEALGLEVIPWCKVSTDIEALDAERDRPSEVAARRGMGDAHPREGIVLRPLIELTKNNGERVIAKYKGEAFAERAKTPKVTDDPARRTVLRAAQAVAEEWVTPMRLTHVLQRFPGAGLESMRAVIAAMVEDVYRESNGEIVESREAVSAIGRRTAELMKGRISASLHPPTADAAAHAATAARPVLPRRERS